MHNPSYVDLPEGPRLMASRGSHDTMKRALTFALVDRSFTALCRGLTVRVPQEMPHDPRLFFDSFDGKSTGQLRAVYAYLRGREPAPRFVRWGQAIATLRYRTSPFAVDIENLEEFPLPSGETSHKNLIPHDGVWLYQPQRQVIRDREGRLLHEAPLLPVELRGGAIPIPWRENLLTAYHSCEIRPDGKRDYCGYIALLDHDFPYPLLGYRRIDASDLHALGLPIKDPRVVRRVHEVLFPTTVNASGESGDVTVLCGLQDGHSVELSIANEHVAELAQSAQPQTDRPDRARRSV